MHLLFTCNELNIRLMGSCVKGEGRKMKLLEARDAYTRVRENTYFRLFQRARKALKKHGTISENRPVFLERVGEFR